MKEADAMSGAKNGKRSHSKTDNTNGQQKPWLFKPGQSGNHHLAWLHLPGQSKMLCANASMDIHACKADNTAGASSATWRQASLRDNATSRCTPRSRVIAERHRRAGRVLGVGRHQTSRW